MTVRVLFFARIRDELGTADCHVEVPTGGLDLAGLQELLIERGGETWSDVLSAENVIRAVNQEVSTDNCALADGDEVAFYPPVTGG